MLTLKVTEKAEKNPKKQKHPRDGTNQNYATTVIINDDTDQ